MVTRRAPNAYALVLAIVASALVAPVRALADVPDAATVAAPVDASSTAPPRGTSTAPPDAGSTSPRPHDAAKPDAALPTATPRPDAASTGTKPAGATPAGAPPEDAAPAEPKPAGAASTGAPPKDAAPAEPKPAGAASTGAPRKDTAATGPKPAGASIGAPPKDTAPPGTTPAAGPPTGAPGDAASSDATPDDAASTSTPPVPPAEVAAPVAPPPAEAVPPASSGAVAAEPGSLDAPPDAKTTSESSLFAIKVILGLVVLVVLAYLGGHRKVIRYQERLGISGVITAGFPFVALGLIASSSSVGVLDPEVIGRLRPLLHFGLGWLGFIIGAQLDIRVLDRVPKGTAYLILVEALGPFAVTAAACGALMLSFGLSWSDPSMWRDVILLGAAAAMTAPRRYRGFANRTWKEGKSVDVLLAQLDEFAGVIGLLFITAYFREDASQTTWVLPDTAWVFVSLGLGVAIGVLIFAMVRVPQSNAEFLAIVLGGLAFASGLAGFLRLSPIVVCFLAGVLVANFPNDQRASIFRILDHLERPVHLLFLIIAGAVWDVYDWRGWALVPLFVIGRVAGKYAGVLAGRTVVGSLLPAGFADRRQLVAPLSGLSIALVISVASLYADTGLRWVMTAVIGGSIVTELLVQLTTPNERAPTSDGARRAAIDELDEDEDEDEDEQPPEPPAPSRATTGGER
ncbi:MAG TPA: hypothetical protein VM513_34020 [Kofleriaceae bacterium]|nr:hypothetical protein [Kofleriaceae bacterium]